MPQAASKISSPSSQTAHARETPNCSQNICRGWPHTQKNVCNVRITLQLTFARCQAERVESCLGRGEQEVILILVLDHRQMATSVGADFGSVAVGISVTITCDNTKHLHYARLSLRAPNSLARDRTIVYRTLHSFAYLLSVQSRQSKCSRTKAVVEGPREAMVAKVVMEGWAALAEAKVAPQAREAGAGAQGVGTFQAPTAVVMAGAARVAAVTATLVAPVAREGQQGGFGTGCGA